MRLLLVFSILGGVMALNAQASKKLTLEDIYKSSRFHGKTVSDVQWFPDGSAFTFTRDSEVGTIKDVYRHSVDSGRETLILEGASLMLGDQPVEMSEYHTTGQQHHLLITGPKRQIWRHSFAAPFYLYDIISQSLIPLAQNDPELQNVTLSPDGQSVAYAKANDLYVASVASGESKRLTADGTTQILNGVFDWVYEEEFGRADAFRWSPDGSKIAFWRTDQSRVKSFILLDELPYYPQQTKLKYPKVGEQNAIIKIGVVDIASGDLVWMDTGNEDDIYVPRIHWTNDPNTLAVQRLNRRQNHLEILLADVTTGATRMLLEDHNDTGWIDVSDDYIFLSGRDELVWTSERDGYRHIYLSGYDGKIIRQLTSGNWEVSSIAGVDESGERVYFYGRKDSNIEHHLYAVQLDGRNLRRISHMPGWHTAEFAPDYRHFVSFASNIKTPPQVSLRRSDGELVRMLEKNDIPALAAYQMSFPQFLTFKTSDGVELNAYMVKPADFDASKKYPVILYGYGGPGSQMVINRWGTGSATRHFERVLWYQLMAEKGYITFCLDNRGTGARGKGFKNLAYGDISKWAVKDHIEGAAYLASLPFVDASRIGFWGWSGGGYLSCMLMTRAGDYFKTAVAVASVSDFRYYDTIWTERYMGLLSDNAAGYTAADVNHYAAGLKGNLLLVHGSGDDNVHPQNTMKFVDELIANNKQFELMIYPNRNHRIDSGNSSLHLFTMITSYFLKNL